MCTVGACHTETEESNHDLPLFSGLLHSRVMRNDHVHRHAASCWFRLVKGGRVFRPLGRGRKEKSLSSEDYIFGLDIVKFLQRFLVCAVSTWFIARGLLRCKGTAATTSDQIDAFMSSIAEHTLITIEAAVILRYMCCVYSAGGTQEYQQKTIAYPVQPGMTFLS